MAETKKQSWYNRFDSLQLKYQPFQLGFDTLTLSPAKGVILTQLTQKSGCPRYDIKLRLMAGL